MPTAFGRFTAVGYRSCLDDGAHLALVHGEIGDGEDAPVYVHHECPTGDALGGLLCDCGTQLRSALAAVAAEGRGVVVYLRGSVHGSRFNSRLSSATTRPQPLTSVPRFFATWACVLLDRPATADVSARTQVDRHL